MKLRGRLALTVAVALLPLSLGAAALQARWRRSALAEGIAEAARARLDETERRRCEANPARWPGRLRRRRGRVRVVALDARYRPARPRAPSPPPELIERVRGGAPWAHGVVPARRRPGARLMVLIRTPWGRGPCAHLLLVRPVGPALGAFGGPALHAALAVSAAAVLLVLLATGPLVARIRRLTAWAHDPRRHQEAPPERGSDEIGQLASAFRTLIEALRQRARQAEAREAALRGYVRATHHDVAVPLTALRAHLARLEEDAARGVPPDSEALGGALAEADYLGTLLRNLATAARLRGEGDIVPSVVDLRQVAEGVLARLEPLARRRSVELERALPHGSLCAEADPVLLGRAWSNLLHNAVRHARGRVALVLDRRPEGFELRVLDDGPGADPERLLDRARRPLEEQPSARGRSGHGGGLGLGLRIAWRIARVHGHRLHFERVPEGGLLVRWTGPYDTPLPLPE